MKMEFNALHSLFSSLIVLKKKYPMIGAHVKHLNDIKEDHVEIEKELKRCKMFLMANPNLGERQFSDSTYPGNKKGRSIHLETALGFANQELVDSFWDGLIELDRFVFPQGHPEPTIEEVNDENSPLALLESNPVLKDVLDQVRMSADSFGDTNDISTMMQSPAFNSIIFKLKSGLENGEFQLDDLIKSITSIISVVKKDLNPEMSEMIETLTSTMTNVQAGGAPDISGLTDMLSKLG
jgi:hypothetical protein